MYLPTRKLTVLALDPSVESGGRILRTQIEIPNELLVAGPRGHRVSIVDYDSSTDSFRSPQPLPEAGTDPLQPPADPFERLSDRQLLSNPDFHACMAFAIVMKTLARFEFALGRRLKWSFPSHQLQVAPHAFADANAFYSDQAQGLFFGYFPSADGKQVIYTCLSHEIVAHETTHALLDGLRERYTDASSPQQAGFHEGFSDIVALLSILSAASIVEKVVDLGLPAAKGGGISRANVSVEALKKSGLFGLAQQLLDLVDDLDDVMNNTSVILLLEVGNRKILLPGDAQLENWSYALSKPEWCKRLAEVNFYTVGYHGSRNATPKRLQHLFKHAVPVQKAEDSFCNEVTIQF